MSTDYSPRSTDHPPRSTRRPGKAAPGPRGNALLGSLRDIRRDPLAFMRSLARDYGGVATYRIAHRRFHLVTDPDGVQRVLHDNHRNYTRDGSITWDTVKLALGDSLLTSDGEPWLQRRRLMQPVFHHRHVAGFAGLMARETSLLLDRWRSPAASGEPIALAAEISRLTLNILVAALFSADVRASADAILEATTVQNEDMNLRLTMPFYPPPAVPTRHNRRLRKALATLDRLIYGLIRTHRERSTPASDLLSLLLEARDELTDHEMSDRQLRDELVSLIFAGHETAANSLVWTFYLLATHPDVARRLCAELDAHPPTEDPRGLPYCQMVLSEALRLYPPAWITTRTAIADDEIGGYHIPAGTQVSLCNYATHRDPKHWEDPDRFDPERFSPERSQRRPRYAYFPFLHGPHQCIGKDFALMETQLIVGMTARRYRLELAHGCTVVPEPLITLRPAGHIAMMVYDR